MQNLSLAISPCPNDTFVFESFINNNTYFNIQAHYLDIQALNNEALNNNFDILKISVAMLPRISNHYTLLRVGSALGFGTGPLLVAKKKYALSAIKNLKVVLPGKDTTATLLFNHFFPDTKYQEYLIFSDIENALLNHQADVGVLIHEGRFTYQNKGLQEIADLGNMWEQQTTMPVPLGCIVVKKNIEESKITQIESLLQQSIRTAYQRTNLISNYIKHHAQEMNDDVIKKHIDLYVNSYTYELDDFALDAINNLWTKTTKIK